MQGYEDGFDGIKTVRELSLRKNLDARDYNGKYEEATEGETSISAVVILGNRR